MHTDRNSPPTTHRRSGFTMIEMIVVVAIIFILMGLFIVVATKMNENNQVRHTRGIFFSLLAVATEYNVTTGATVSADPGADDADAGTTIGLFVDATYPLPVTKKMLTALDDDAFNPDHTDQDMRNVVLDAWGTPIRYAPRNDWGNGTTTLPQYPRLFFASAGPDEAWGDVQSQTPEAQDNLYSFDLE